MKKFKRVKEITINFINKNKKKVEIAVLTFMMTFATTVPAYADISGETIKNNVLRNFLGPIFLLAVCFILVKEFITRNVARIVVTVIIGAFIAIFIYYPEILKVVMNTIRGIIGV